MNRVVISLICSLIAVSFVTTASGGPVTWEFGGVITFVSDPNGFLNGTVTTGNTFSGSFAFEPTTPDIRPNDPRLGIYEDAITNVTGQINGQPDALLFGGPILDFPNGPANFIEVSDERFFGRDRYFVLTGVDFIGAPFQFILSVRNDVGDLFADDTLPLEPPEFSSLTGSFFEILNEGAVGVGITGELTFLVPEPGTLVLIGAGVMWLVKPRRKR